jgi:membrane protease subunit HflK
MPWSNQNGGRGSGGGWQSGGSGGGGGGGGPWGQGPSGGRPPDLEDMLRKGQDKLRSMIPGGGGGGKYIWLIVALVVLGGWALKGAYTVQPDETGIELLLGKAKAFENNPGLHFHFWPFETVETPKTRTENKLNIGFGSTRQADAESLMLSGDQNIVNIEFTVLWKISDARAYLFNVRDQERLVRVVAESAMRDHVGQTRADVIRTTGRDEAQVAVQKLLQETLDTYKAGIRIVGIKIEKADPPQPVNNAFEEVQRAKQDQDRVLEEAQKYANKILGEARGQAAQIREQANAYKGRVVAEAEGEAKRFLSVYAEYKKAKHVTRKRLFLETLEKVLGSSNKVIIEQNKGSGVVPYLPLPEIAKRRPGAGDK